MAMAQLVGEVAGYSARLLEFTQTEIDLLDQHRELLLSCTDQIAPALAGRLRSSEQPQAVSAQQPDPGEAITQWYAQTVTKAIDDSYWRWQWSVGIVYIKRGLTMPMMLSMADIISDIVLHASFQALGPEDGRRLYQSFRKLTTIVTALIAEGYRTGALEAVARATGFSPALINTYIMTTIDEVVERTRQEIGKA